MDPVCLVDVHGPQFLPSRLPENLCLLVREYMDMTGLERVIIENNDAGWIERFQVSGYTSVGGLLMMLRNARGRQCFGVECSHNVLVASHCPVIFCKAPGAPHIYFSAYGTQADYEQSNWQFFEGKGKGKGKGGKGKGNGGKGNGNKGKGKGKGKGNVRRRLNGKQPCPPLY